MIKSYNVTLRGGTIKKDFLQKLSCSCIDTCDEVDSVLVLELDDSQADSIKDLDEVLDISEEPKVFSPDLPIFFSKETTFIGVAPALTESGSDYSSLQFYFLNNQIDSANTIGTHPTDISTQASNRYISPWTGKNVDIVTLEVNALLDYPDYHDTHPDFDNLESPGNTRVIAMNWPNSSGPNLQVASNNVLSQHAIGVVSAGAGTVCGFAKKASIRACYITNIVSNINSIIQWHNSKPINPITQVKDPTIMISEFQYLFGNRIGTRIEDISSFTHLGITTERPPGGWGDDLTVFINANIIPKRIRDPQDALWYWTVVVPIQNDFIQLKSALQSAWDAGITVFNAAGNDGTVYAKDSDEAYDSLISVESGATIYNISRSGIGIAQVTKSTLVNPTSLFLFRAYGPHGLDKSIDVAAIQGSESFPIIEPYSVRGAGIDVTGMGTRTWTSYPINTYADGFQWGMFGGTSCAAPTAVGIAACLMERHYYYNNKWPTPNEIKEILISRAKKGVLLEGLSLDWSDLPDASSNITQTDIFDGGTNILRIENNVTNLNGGVRMREFAGSPNIRAFIDNSVLRVDFLSRNRPESGFVYPRSIIRR